MKVCVVSEFRSNYDAALECSFVRAFQDLGAQTASVSTYSVFHKEGATTLRANLVPYVFQRECERAVRSSQADLVVLVKATDVHGETIRRWRADGMRVVNYFPDNPFEARRTGEAFFSLLGQLRACDAIYVPDRFSAGQLRQLGVHADFMAFARDPRLHHPAKASRSDTKIVFVGNPDPERIRYLAALADLDLHLWGNWEWAQLGSGHPLRACVKGGVLLGERLCEELSSAALSINVMRASQKTAHNMRSFESPACQVATLSERTNAVEELFAESEEVAMFSSPEELRQVTLRLLEEPAARERLAQGGWDRVRADTYEVRARAILEQAGARPR